MDVTSEIPLNRRKRAGSKEMTFGLISVNSGENSPKHAISAENSFKIDFLAFTENVRIGTLFGN